MAEKVYLRLFEILDKICANITFLVSYIKYMADLYPQVEMLNKQLQAMGFHDPFLNGS